MALVAVLAVVAAVVTVIVSSATYSPGIRTLSPKTQVAAGVDHVDPDAGLIVRVPEGWRVESGDVIFGSTVLVPESAEDKTDSAGRLGGIVLVGALTPDFVASQEADNQRAAVALIIGMGELFLPIPGQQVDHRMDEISTDVGDGWALSYRVVADPALGAGTPAGGLVYTAVVGEGDARFWLTYVGSPADGAMDSPHAEWADEIVTRLRPSEASSSPLDPVGEPA
ncbi:hypothetical protein FQ137_04575 [Dietzia sp. ANT_WB102]|nr:hypothetical protein FQ137_04575 [Dietzia sp. ANT_WB102]